MFSWRATVFKVICLPGFFISALSLSQGEDNTEMSSGANLLEPMTVQAQPVEKRATDQLDLSLPGHLLNENKKIDLQIQGSPQTQTDFAIRGASFSDVGYTLEGISLKNPQTSHFNSALPFPAYLFQQPQVSTGLERVLDGAGFLAGSVEMDFATIKPGTLLQAGFGTADSDQQRMLWSGYIPGMNNWGLTVFGARLNRADGTDYGGNYLDSWNSGMHMQYRDADTQSDFAVSFREKDFGATGYYGVSPTLEAREQTRDLLGIASFEQELRLQTIRGAWTIRRFEDEYALPGINYRNQHRTYTTNALLGGTIRPENPLRWHWRVSGAYDEIDSNQLGSHDRHRSSIAFIPEYKKGPFTLVAGGKLAIFSEAKENVIPLGGIAYKLAQDHTVHGSISGSTRMPSFTELDYKSPGSLGNRGLDKQQSVNTEIGYTGRVINDLRLELTAFRRTIENAVDWLKTNRGGPWQASNLQEVTTYGTDLKFRYRFNEGLTINGGYAYLSKHGIDGFYAGRYRVDYPEHAADLGITWTFNGRWRIKLNNSVHWQTENRARTSDHMRITGNLRVMYSPRFANNANLILSCRNLWNETFQHLPGQEPPQRHIRAVMQYRF